MTIADYQKELIDLTKDMPERTIAELVDFAQFLRTKNENEDYSEIGDSAAYIKSLRKATAKNLRSSKNFIDDLVEWQKSN